jgi:hypothetical protein
VAITDSPWDALSARMDADVDDGVGDRILYSTDGSDPVAVLPGFVLFDSETGEGLTRSSFGLQLDETLGSRNRIKIRADLIGGAPQRNHRIRHPKLGNFLWQPAGSDPETQGRYVIFDIQKV